MGDTYTHGHHDAVLRSHRSRTVENSAAYLVPHLAPGATLLDVGCGPGTLTVDLATRVAPGAVIGVDVSAAVVDEARTHAATAGAANVSFAAGDFRDLPDLGSFDVVHAHQVLQHLSDPVGALRSMAAHARPGGVVAVRDSDYRAMAWAPADERLDRWMAIYQAVARGNRAEPDAGRHLVGWARRAGLTDVTYTTSTWTWWTPDQRRWWSDLWAERTASSALADQAIERELATAAELAEIAAGWRAWAESLDAVFVVPHGELVARI